MVAELTVRSREKRDGVNLNSVLEEIGDGRKELLLASKDWISRAKEATSAREAGEILTIGEERLLDLFGQLVYKPLEKVMALQNAMEKTPAVKTSSPAVVLVGAPNVGKSSIVKTISSGMPKIADYPFTTRGMTLGHVKGVFDVGGEGGEIVTQLCQVMDSPGLLSRPDEERNEMEALTLAAMQHLPTAVMYVMDLSGGAGEKCSSVEDQLELRREMRARFPRRPWLDVISKCDLGIQEETRKALHEILGYDASYLEVSVMDGTGIEELRDEVMKMLSKVRVVLDVMEAVDANNTQS